MRRIFQSIILVALVLTTATIAIAQDSNPQIEVSYDRLKDRTRVRLLGLQVEGTLLDGLQMSLLFVFKGQRQTKPVAQVTLIMTSTSVGWRFLEGSRNLRATIDGVMLNLGDLPRVSSQVGQGYVIEHLMKKVPGEIVLKLAASKKLEMQMGGMEFKLTPEQLALLRNFAAHMKL
jgi:hypothetical protein